MRSRFESLERQLEQLIAAGDKGAPAVLRRAEDAGLRRGRITAANTIVEALDAADMAPSEILGVLLQSDFTLNEIRDVNDGRVSWVAVRELSKALGVDLDARRRELSEANGILGAAASTETTIEGSGEEQ
jgi:hypothetical protein